MPKPLTCCISCQISSHKECVFFFVFFPSPRLLNHSQHLNILLSSSPPTCYDKERCNVRKDTHSTRCTHRSPRGRLPRRACVCVTNRTADGKRNSERWGEHPGTTFEAKGWLLKQGGTKVETHGGARVNNSAKLKTKLSVTAPFIFRCLQEVKPFWGGLLRLKIEL